MAARRDGTVVEFDPRRGTGIVEAADAGRLPFHCTEIADGSRSVTVGAPVRYDVVPGPLGQWEARRLDPR